MSVTKPRPLMCANTLTHLKALLLQHFQERFHYTHTHKQLCTGDLFNDDTHPYICLMVWKNTYFSFTFIGAFSLPGCSITRNWRTYSSVCDESSQQRQSYCRLYCETSGRGAPILIRMVSYYTQVRLRAHERPWFRH